LEGADVAHPVDEPDEPVVVKYCRSEPEWRPLRKGEPEYEGYAWIEGEKMPEYFWWEDGYSYPEIIVEEEQFQCSLCGKVWYASELALGQQDCPVCGGSLYSANFTRQILEDERP